MERKREMERRDREARRARESEQARARARQAVSTAHTWMRGRHMPVPVLSSAPCTSSTSTLSTAPSSLPSMPTTTTSTATTTSTSEWSSWADMGHDTPSRAYMTHMRYGLNNLHPSCLSQVESDSTPTAAPTNSPVTAAVPAPAPAPEEGGGRHGQGRPQQGRGECPRDWARSGASRRHYF